MEAATQRYANISRNENRESLILEHLEYVRQILGTMTPALPSSVDVDNLESAGVVGLIEAANSYDPKRGVVFKTYAYPRIRGAIVDELRRNSPLSQKMLKQIARIRNLCETLPPPVTPETIMEMTGMNFDDVEECLEAMRLAKPQPWSDLLVAIHQIQASTDQQPDQAMEAKERSEILATCIEQMPERERIVLTLYHLEELRLLEIGEVLGISEGRVSRVLARAEQRLKELFRRSML
jgi:RNA polymerase sigma factor FliA